MRRVFSARIADGGISKHQWALPSVFQSVQNKNIFADISISDIRASLNGISEKDAAYISDMQIQRWVLSAKHALYRLQQDKNYVLKVDKVAQNGRLESVLSVIIVDYLHTGQLNQKSRWGNGVHEFLELKHGLKMGQGSLTSASMSHPIFFGYYDYLYGVTGTMGNCVER